VRGVFDGIGQARRTIWRVTSRPAAAQHLRDLARLRRARDRIDRIDREYAKPFARGVNMSAEHFRCAAQHYPAGNLISIQHLR
jgi:hypothetical protein